VQGINDLVTPFFQIFLSAYIGELIPKFLLISLLISLLDTDPEDFDPSLFPLHALSAIEADSFWCLSRLLDGIQDNYIFAQPGIQRSVKRMAELIARIDGLCNHIHCLCSFLSSSFLSLSSSIGSPRITKRRIHAVRLSLDELSINA
jgi:Rab-GTPase-TBC domain